MAQSSTLPSTGDVNPLQRQPTTFDFAQTNQFKVYLPIFPTMEWFVVRANIPGVTLGQTVQATPFTDSPVSGDKLQYDDFNMTFLVDEKLENLMELYAWMMNIGFPFSRNQFNRLERPDNLNMDTKSVYNSSVGRNLPTTDSNLYTDILMTIMSSKNNAVANMVIYRAFPINLSGMDYSSAESDTTYAECTVTFAYQWYDIQSV